MAVFTGDTESEKAALSYRFRQIALLWPGQLQEHWVWKWAVAFVEKHANSDDPFDQGVVTNIFKVLFVAERRKQNRRKYE